ncbi:ribonuclease BN, partial [Mycobacterium manitobense]|nr:ribonuclease BN [[Mycobacterium] manitobense]
MLGWLDRVQQRSRAAGFVIAVIYKYVDDQSNYLAALITY